MIISTPRGTIAKDERGKAVLTWNQDFVQKYTKRFNEVQKHVDSEVLRKCDPYVPKDSGMLIKSGILGTVLGSGLVVYNAPYARKQYYTNKGNGNHNASGLRGAYWFERMKADHKGEILEGAKKVAGVK